MEKRQSVRRTFFDERKLIFADNRLDSLAKALIDWSLKSNSVLIVEFLRKKGMNWSEFVYCSGKNPNFKTAAGIAKANIVCNWLAKKKEDLSPYLEKMWNRYSRAYDEMLKESEDATVYQIALDIPGMDTEEPDRVLDAQSERIWKENEKKREELSVDN